MNIKSILLSTTATLLLTIASASAQAEKTEQSANKQQAVHHAEKTKHEAKAKHKAKTVEHHKKKAAVNKPVKKVIVKAPVVANTVLRSCNAFGPGYFTIPGTSTCLKFNGRLLGDLMLGSTLNADYFTTFKTNTDARAGISFQGRLGASTMTATSLGRLHTYAELRGGYGSGLGFIGLADQEKREAESNGVKVHFAYAEIGGVRFGIDESIFNTWTGVFGAVENNTILNPLVGTVMGTVNYTFNAKNGVSAIIGAETYNKSVDGLQRDGIHKVTDTRRKGEDINLVAGIKYMQGWGDIIAAAAYDGYYESLSGRLRVDGKINDRMTLWAMASVKNLKDAHILDTRSKDAAGNPVTSEENLLGDKYFLRNSVRSPYADWDGRWQGLVGATYKMTPKADINGQLGFTSVNTVAASANIEYRLANGFVIVPELSYVAWHDNTTFTAPDEKKERTNFLKGKHEIQALLHVGYKF
ncbi:MAG: porin [Alphaproteobacteria bacterium]|nr:porin [Alphaproteobacteria bacterium]